VATQRSTFGKRDREMAKAAKARAKRERRDSRSELEPAAPAPEMVGGSAAELVEQLAELHTAYDDGRIAFEDFDEQKAELIDQIALRMANEPS
jgi:alkanesulfonate monooxygenase SsuD/methylene tetrahydromethanopterin reductase-like flavin-dependent oxidoreductase (luciferase family)